MFRLLSIIMILSFLSACRGEIVPSDRIVTFIDSDRIIGRGCDAGDHTIITATHVVRACERADCSIRSKLGSPENLSYYQKESFNDSTTLRPPRIILDFSFPEISLGQMVYTLVSRSGSFTRIDGKVTSYPSSYISYDMSSSGVAYTGAIETDIVFLPGESGSPLLTLSGEIIGVVSAVDKERGRSYVVR